MTKVITDLKLSDSSYSHVLDIAADKIDIAD